MFGKQKSVKVREEWDEQLLDLRDFETPLANDLGLMAPWAL
jgi:hypothetical protein